jgi:hypothetical protein
MRLIVLAVLLVSSPVLAERIDSARQLGVAQVQYGKGNYQKAIYLARPLTGTKDRLLAWRIVGSASCKMNDVAQANEAYAWLDRDGRRIVVDVCRRAGILFDNGRFGD